MVNYKTITLDYMMDYIEKNAPTDKEWFKSVAIVKGKYNHLKAKKAFCERYMPNIIPVAKPIERASDKLLQW